MPMKLVGIASYAFSSVWFCFMSVGRYPAAIRPVEHRRSGSRRCSACDRSHRHLPYLFSAQNQHQRLLIWRTTIISAEQRRDKSLLLRCALTD